jgi:(R,R)-butanediol dehydrogenase/meso-butanediol dehydrogenase/diacetyl reductase
MDHQSMFSAVFLRSQEIQMEQRLVPAPGAEEALIRVEYTAICGSDQARFWDSGEVPQKPIVLGHEFSGRIVTTLAGKGLTIGQEVTVAPLFNCGDCEFCRAGKENMCPKRRRFGVAVDGALQEYVCIPTDRIFPLPAHISLAEGALIEPLAVAYHAVRRAGVPAGEGALVLGAGAIGLLIAQVWRALGYGSIAVIDIDSKRLAIAQQLGFPVWKEVPEKSGFLTIFEATGSGQAFSTWLPALAPRGKVVVVSKLEAAVSIDWVDLMRKEGEIITSRFFTFADFENSIDLVRNGTVQLNSLIGMLVPFQKLSENHGVEVMALAKEMIRLLVQVRD